MSVRATGDGTYVGAPLARRSLADVLAAGMQRLRLAPTAMDQQGEPSLRVKLSRARKVAKADPALVRRTPSDDASPKTWSEAQLGKTPKAFDDEWLGDAVVRVDEREARRKEEEALHERKRALLDPYIARLPLMGNPDYKDPDTDRQFSMWAMELGLDASQLKQYVRKRLKQRRVDAMSGALASMLAHEELDPSLLADEELDPSL